jgi:COP9 signalosome complex subunit 2
MVLKTKDLLRMSKTEAKAEVEEAINKILETVNNKLTDNQKRKEMYTLILEDLKVSNERLWFNTSLRMGAIYMETDDLQNLNDMLLLLKTACKKADAMNDDLLDVDVYDMSKGNHLLEVFALEIQMCIKTKETRRMKQIYNLT